MQREQTTHEILDSEKITKKTIQKMNQQLLEVHEKRMKNKLNPQRGEIKFILLNDSMLRKKKYDIEVLEKNIYTKLINLTCKLFQNRTLVEF